MPATLFPESAPKARPVVLTHPSRLADLRARLPDLQGPAAESWTKTSERAEEALTREFVPYQGEEYLRYYRTGRDQAQFIRDLALAFHLTGDTRYGLRAKEILLAWADEFPRHYDFPARHPASEIPHASGLVIGRTAVLFTDCYALLWELLEPEERARVETWFRGLVPPIMQSMRLWEVGEYQGMGPPYFRQQYFNNHLGACVMGLLSIGYALGDADLVRYVTERPEGARRPPNGKVEQSNRRDLATLIEGVIFMPGDFGSEEEGDVWRGGRGDPSLRGAPPPQPGETWDRYRVVEGKGIHYSLLHLRLLTLMAEMVANNRGRDADSAGPDFFAFTGHRGENLRISYERYAPWFVTMDATAVNDGYYVSAAPQNRPAPRVEGNLDMLALYEIAAVRYPESAAIVDALKAREDAGERVAYDQETFAWTAALIYSH